MIWLVVLWVALVALWGAVTPGTSADTVHRVARHVRARWQARVEHPFDWAKD